MWKKLVSFFLITVSYSLFAETQQELSSKVVVITGDLGGVAQPIAHKYAKEGFSVVLAGTDREEGASLVQELEKIGIEALFYPCHPLSSAEHKKLVELTAKKFNNIDVCISIASPQVAKQMEDYGVREWNHSIANQLRTPFLMLNTVSPIMKKNGGGLFLFINPSSQEKQSFTHLIASAGLRSMIDSAVAQFPGIRVNCLMPFFTEEKKEEGSKDLADFAYFLSTRSARLINGNFITMQDLAVANSSIEEQGEE